MLEEYFKTYQKQFGINHYKGDEEEIAKSMYKDKYEHLLATGVLFKKIVFGKVFVAHREIIAGQEKGKEDGKGMQHNKKVSLEECPHRTQYSDKQNIHSRLTLASYTHVLFCSCVGISMVFEDWKAAKESLVALGWFFDVPACDDDKLSTKAWDKLNEALFAHEKMLKDAKGMKDSLRANNTGTLQPRSCHVYLLVVVIVSF